MFKMMTSADVQPDEFPDWYIFNTYLQKVTGEAIHLDIPTGFDELHERLEAGNVDFVYANPYDASILVREKGFLPVVFPENQPDEIVLVTAVDSPIARVKDLPENARIAMTDEEDVRLIGMMLIEPANLHANNVQVVRADNGVAVAKKLINGEADVGFILAKSFDLFSNWLDSSLRVLVRSDISVMRHCLMAKPTALARSNIFEALIEMHEKPAQKTALENMGVNKWIPAKHDEVEFMIDLMETLK